MSAAPLKGFIKNVAVFPPSRGAAAKDGLMVATLATPTPPFSSLLTQMNSFHYFTRSFNSHHLLLTDPKAFISVDGRTTKDSI